MPKKPVHRSISFRPAEPADRPFLLQVYGSTRADELAMTGWDDAQKQAFIEMQFRAQDLDYHRNYPDASFQVINVDGQAAGRLYVRRSLDTIWIIDIALLPEHRGQGLGTRMLRELQEEARAAGKPLWIHVERFNPALKLYVRLGFTLIEDQGVYLLLEWSPDGASSAPAAQPSTRQNSGA